MSRNEAKPYRGPERRKSARDPAADGRPGATQMRRGRSGYGIESIRPHLHAQLEQRKLLHPTFPPEDPEHDAAVARRMR